MERRSLRKVIALISLGIVLVGFVLVIGAPPEQAVALDGGDGEAFVGGEQVVIRAEYTDNPPAYVPPPARALSGAPDTATINVTYTGGWDPQAQAAFQYAVDIWETLITSPVTIEVVANWAPLGGSALGSAGPDTYHRDFGGAPVANVWYPVALANKLAGSDLDPSDPDINATFNSSFTDWYFGTDGNPPINKWDLASVVLHEIGHGLGFAGSMRVGGTCGPGLGCWGLFGDVNNYPVVYDLFTENGSGTPLLNFTNFSSGLATELTSNSVFFNAPLATPHNVCQPVKLYAPGSWVQGSSYSHLDEVFNGTSHALMTFSITNGEANHHPGSITLAMFEDMTWDTIVASPLGGAQSIGPEAISTLVGDPNIYLPVIIRTGIPCVPIP